MSNEKIEMNIPIIDTILKSFVKQYKVYSISNVDLIASKKGMWEAIEEVKDKVYSNLEWTHEFYEIDLDNNNFKCYANVDNEEENQEMSVKQFLLWQIAKWSFEGKGIPDTFILPTGRVNSD